MLRLRQPDLLLATLAALCRSLACHRRHFAFGKDFSKMLTGTGVTLLGVIYVAFLGGFLVATRMGFEGH